MHETYEEKQVIEADVIENLPSVKKLAEIYGKDNNTTHEVQLIKPKVFSSTLCATFFQGRSKKFLAIAYQ